jgi:hypothetical protein
MKMKQVSNPERKEKHQLLVDWKIRFEKYKEN